MKVEITRVALFVVKSLSGFSFFLKENYFRSQALVHPSARFIHGAQVYNIVGDKNAIRVGANTIVAGHLLTFKHGGEIEIGDWCYIGENSRIWSAKLVSIGSRVLISHGVNIHDTNSHSLNAHERHQHFVLIATVGHPESVPNLFSAPVVIEDDAWIGCNAILLKGVRIGRESIVAAGSVVTKDVPEKVVVAGNPARVIRKLE